MTPEVVAADSDKHREEKNRNGLDRPGIGIAKKPSVG